MSSPWWSLQVTVSFKDHTTSYLFEVIVLYAFEDILRHLLHVFPACLFLKSNESFIIPKLTVTVVILRKHCILGWYHFSLFPMTMLTLIERKDKTQRIFVIFYFLFCSLEFQLRTRRHAVSGFA